MIRLLTIAWLFAFGCASAADAPAKPDAPSQEFPRVAAAGGVYRLPGKVVMPAKDATHRVVIDATDNETTASGVNKHLESAARALNLYSIAGVPDGNVEVAVVVHGKATPLVLSNDAYRAKFGKDNPNTKLIGDLTKAGAAIYVCGQALSHQGHAVSDVGADVIVSLSAMTALVDLHAKGYGLIP